MAHNTEMMIHGAMTEVTVLDQPADWVDYAAAAARWSHRNLLDNAYFANTDAIIDQRGWYVVPPDTPYYSDTDLITQAGTVSAYTKATQVNSTYGTITVSGTTYYVAWSAAVRGYTGAGYGIDRWVTDIDAGGGITITDNGIVIASAGTYWGTRLDNIARLSGKTVTGSILMSNGTLYSGTIESVKWQLNAAQTIFSNTDITLYISKIGDGKAKVEISTGRAGVGIKAAKLELGTVQTLAHQDENGVWQLNEIPDYGEQLARCLRCAEKSCNMGTSVGSPETASPIIKVAYSKWGFCEPMVFFKVPKRAIPAVKIFSAKTGAEGMAYDETAMQDVAVTPSYVGQNSFTVQHASENLVTGHAYQFYYFATADL